MPSEQCGHSRDNVEHSMQENVRSDTNICDLERQIKRNLSEKSSAKTYASFLQYLQDASDGLESSVYVIDFADILLKVQTWFEKFPHVHPFYAVKSNSDPLLLRLLTTLGFSFDCSSKEEIEMALLAGAEPKNIIFAHTVKATKSLNFAQKIGVDFMTFDSVEELDKIHNHFPSARLLIRLMPKEIGCAFDLSDKFGCDSEEAESVLTAAKRLSMNVIGVSFHVGGLCKSSASYYASIQACRDVFEIAKRLGFKFNILDIGGGFSGAKGTDKLFEDIHQEIQRSLQEFFPENDVTTIAEPGTYFVGSAQYLITPIVGRRKMKSHKHIENGRKNIERYYYYISNSIYSSFFKGIEAYDTKHRPLLNNAEVESRKSYVSTLFGHTCCGEDVIVKECEMAEMKSGECLLWENIGSYSREICSTFCGFPIPSTRYVFVRNPRLNLENLKNSKEVSDLLLKSCDFIEAQ